jgi:hypothetical protein
MESLKMEDFRPNFVAEITELIYYATHPEEVEEDK